MKLINTDNLIVLSLIVVPCAVWWVCSYVPELGVPYVYPTYALSFALELNLTFVPVVSAEPVALHIIFPVLLSGTPAYKSFVLPFSFVLTILQQ